MSEQSKLAVGSTPNLAARLQGLAAANQIVIAASARRLVGNSFELTDYNFEVRECTPGECHLHVPFKAKLERPGGIVSGMTIMGAVDVAMWLAIMTIRGTEEVWVTGDMKTAFLMTGKEEPLVCVARVLKIGKHIAYGTVDTVGDTSALIAHRVITYCHVPK